MFVSKRKKEKYQKEKRVIREELQKWRDSPYPKSFFCSMLDPIIRYTGVLMSKFRVNFCIVDRMNFYQFYCLYDHENGKTFEFRVDDDEKERLSTITKEKLIEPRSSLKELLDEILKRYLGKYPVRELPEPNKLPSGVEVDPVEFKCLQHYAETWDGFIPRNQMPRLNRRNDVDRLVGKKQEVIQELMNLLKHPLPNCTIRALNTFLWHIDLNSNFFDKQFRESLEKENFEVVHLQVRFSLGYPEHFPFIRVMEPRLIHDKLSMCGVLQDKFVFESFRVLLEKLKLRMRYFKVDLSCPTEQSFYDEDFSKTDWKRIDIYRNSAQFPTLNRFNRKFHAVPPIFHFESNEKAESLEYGNKVILPSSVLNSIFQANPQPIFPILFEVKSESSTLFCGVKEFSSKNHQAVIPHWMLRGLGLPNGGEVTIRCVSLPQCTHIKMMPHDASFLRRVRNYKLLMESSLRNFFTLTIGDSIPVLFGNTVFWMYVVELEPSNAVTIVASNLGILETTFEVIPPPFAFAMEGFAQTLSNKGIPLEGGSGDGSESATSLYSGETPTSVTTPLRTVDDLVDEVQTPMKQPGVNYVKCENCRHSVNEWNYGRHLPHCKKTYYRCPQCHKVVKLADKEAHETEFHKKIKCRKCSEKLEKSNIYIHLRFQCPKRITYCQFFGCPVPADELSEHESECGCKTDKCPKCGELVYMVAKGIHQVSCENGGTTKDPNFNPRLAFKDPEKYSPQAVMSAIIEKELKNSPQSVKIDGVEYDVQKALEMSFKKSKEEIDDAGKEEEEENEGEKEVEPSTPYGRPFNYSTPTTSSNTDLFFKKHGSRLHEHDDGEEEVDEEKKDDDDDEEKDNQPKLLCPFCSEDVKDEIGLIGHVLDNHTQISGRAKCPICKTWQEPFYNHLCRVHIK